MVQMIFTNLISDLHVGAAVKSRGRVGSYGRVPGLTSALRHRHPPLGLFPTLSLNSSELVMLSNR